MLQSFYLDWHFLGGQLVKSQNAFVHHNHIRKVPQSNKYLKLYTAFVLVNLLLAICIFILETFDTYIVLM